MNIPLDTSILITGAAGGLGRATVESLTKKGFNNIYTPSRQELDLLDRSAVNKYFEITKPKVIIHLASIVFGLLGNQQNQMKALMDNTIINTNVFSAIDLYPADYVFFAGTVAAYPYPYTNIPLIENDFFQGLPHEGEFGYAMSKRHAYNYLHILNQTKGTRFTYGIFTNLYGENDRFNDGTGHVIPSLIMKAYHAKKENIPFSVWGNGSAERDFLHFDDAAAAILCCMSSEQTPQLVNISSGVALTIKKLSEQIATEVGLNDINFMIDKPVGIPSRVVDNTLIKKIGFRQKITIEEGIRRTYQWYVNNIENARV